MATYSVARPWLAARADHAPISLGSHDVGLALFGCHDDPPVVYPTTAPLDVNKLSLGPGDKLNLTVFYGSHSFQAAYTLDSSGEISVQYIGAVAANGKTVEQVRDDLEERLADGFLNDPIVSLTIAELNSLTLSVSGSTFTAPGPHLRRDGVQSAAGA